MSSVIEFIPIPHLIKCRITAVGVDHNCTLMNIFNFDKGATPTAADVLSVCNVVENWINNHYAGQVSEFVRFVNVEAWSGEEQFGPMHSTGMDQVGTAISTSTLVDYAWAPLIGLKTATRGRFATGKWYAFTPVLEAMAIGQYQATHLIGLVGAAANLLDVTTSAGHPWCVASETRLALYPITEFKPSYRLTEQTRRRPDFGR